MKKGIIIAFLFVHTLVHGQNIGIGTNNPMSKLEVNGSFKISAEYIGPVNAPTAAQTYTMVNAALVTMPINDSIGRVYDPGGPANNYIANLTARFLVNFNSSPNSYLELLIESIQLGTDDSLIIYDGDDVDFPVLSRVGNGFTGSNISLDFTTNVAYCVFKSNSDASTGAGFSMLFKRRFINPAVPDQPAVTGNGFVFDAKNGILRAGAIRTGTKGNLSTAFGRRTIASGENSTATGNATTASGNSSTSMGLSTIASGNYSTAMGAATIALGNYSTTMGTGTKARSYASLAIGSYNDTLSTENPLSWQAGDRVLVIGDGNANTNRSSCFYILKNGNGWMQGTLTQASDARLKTNITQLNDVLPKLLRLNGYNYYWKDKENMPGLQTGFIAQELQKEMPELVTSNTEGQLAVNYSGMAPYLLQGIKEQQQMIEKLQQENREIKKMLQQLLNAAANDIKK